MKIRIQNKGLRERITCHIDIIIHLNNLHILSIHNRTNESLRYIIYTDIVHISTRKLNPHSKYKIILNIELNNSRWVQVNVYNNFEVYPIETKRVYINGII